MELTFEYCEFNLRNHIITVIVKIVADGSETGRPKKCSRKEVLGIDLQEIEMWRNGQEK
jgi:hypothetical protein